MSLNPNERIEVDPAHAAPAHSTAHTPAPVGSPVLGATTASVAGVKTGNPYYDESHGAHVHHGVDPGNPVTGSGLRGNSIDHVREVDSYPEDHKHRSDSIKKNDIEAEVQNGDRLTDSDVDNEDKEMGRYQRFRVKHRAHITIAIHVLIGAVMTG